MATVFLSYSKKDCFFAELVGIKLFESGIELWRDQGQLRAGLEYRQEIERGITASVAILVALSAESAESAYVTFEWSYALGKGKPVIPVKLSDCRIHPRLEIIQHLDFTVPNALPWESLVERIREIETDTAIGGDIEAGESKILDPTLNEPHAKAILSYLNQRGYQMASFDRLRRRIDETLTDEDFKDIISRNSTVFRLATLKDNVPGIAKRVP